jgi:hypothetical protein
MKTSDLNARTNELLKDMIGNIKKECKRLATSGAMDYSQDDSRTYRAAKTILAVALENVAAGITIFNAEDKNNRANLRKF